VSGFSTYHLHLSDPKMRPQIFYVDVLNVACPCGTVGQTTVLRKSKFQIWARQLVSTCRST